MSTARLRVALAAALTLAAQTPLTADNAVESALRAGWVGRWVVLRTASFSDCDGGYTNNRLRGTLPGSRGAHRLEPGEVGQVDNLHLRRSRVDLLVGLAEPLRVELRDGPFQLFEQRECRIELQLPAPRSAVRGGDLGQLGALLTAAVEPHPSAAAAAASPLASGRRVEPLPPDHQERWIAYRAWQLEQLGRALRERLATALDRIDRLLAGTARGPSYAEGLLEGARELDREPRADCPELPDLLFSPRRGAPPAELGEDDRRDWQRGWEDGQRLAFEVALAQRLERCLP